MEKRAEDFVKFKTVFKLLLGIYEFKKIDQVIFSLVAKITNLNDSLGFAICMTSLI